MCRTIPSTRNCRLKSWRVDERGSVATMFGLIALMFLAFGGFTVDQSRGFSVKSDLQGAMDAAAIATARYKLTYPDADASAVFEQHLLANWSGKAAATTPVVSQFSTANETVSATATTSLETMFMGLLGHDKMSVATTTSLQFGVGEMEVALVLDNTFSMSGSKLTALKDAATLLVETIKPDSTSSENVKVSLVPFGQYVNVGLGNRSASWISVPNDYTDSSYSCYTVTPVLSKSGCSTETRTGTNDGVSYTYNVEVCDSIEYGEPEEQCGTQTTNHVWRGCVGSRNNPLDTQDSDYGTDPIIGLLDTWCPSEIAPLNNQKSDVLNAINSMTATGETYIPSGLMWGWRTLSKSEPFNQASAYGTGTTSKVLVLMTDGANTKSPTYPKHDGSDAAEANALTATVCDNVKATGIQIYTVTFDVTDTTIKDLMQNCASGSGNYYDAADSAELESSFKSIAVALVDIRFTN